MKKVLFASTALVAFSGAAVADVALSGRAEMGIFDQGLANRGVEFFTDIDVTFTMTGETDNGLTFGASVDLDEGGDNSAAVDDNTDDGGATIFISGNFGTVTMGDTDGALDWALTEAGNVGNPGSIADDETSHAGYIGAYLDGSQDGQILRWDYTVGDFGIAVSIEDDNGGVPVDSQTGYAIGLRYNLDLGGTTVALGLGYQQAAYDTATVALKGITVNSDLDAFGASASATFDNGLSVGIVYVDWDDNSVAVGPDSNMGIGIGYTTGAFSVHANYGVIELDNGLDLAGYGLSAAYDLGGGAVVHFGYRSDDVDAGAIALGASELDTFSLGLGLSF